MSSYRKNRYPQKAEPARQQPVPSEPEYINPGTERSIYTSRLTSGLAYQRQIGRAHV